MPYVYLYITNSSNNKNQIQKTFITNATNNKNGNSKQLPVLHKSIYLFIIFLVTINVTYIKQVLENILFSFSVVVKVKAGKYTFKT